MEELEITEIQKTFRGFDGVWSRVSGGDNNRGSEEHSLRRLIRREQENAAAFRQLARCSQCCARASLMGMASAAQQRGCRLRAELFIREGDDYRPDDETDVSSSRLTALRDLMRDTRTLAELYEHAAEEADCGDLREVLTCGGEQNRAASRALREMILDSFQV